MANSIRARIDAFWAEVADAGAFWSWGDDEGITPWGDELDRAGAPLWSSEQIARTEYADDPDGDRPLEFPVSSFIETVLRWHERREDVAVFLQPVDGRIMVTLTLEEFANEMSKRLDLGALLPPEVHEKVESVAHGARPRLP